MHVFLFLAWHVALAYKISCKLWAESCLSFKLRSHSETQRARYMELVLAGMQEWLIQHRGKSPLSSPGSTQRKEQKRRQFVNRSELRLLLFWVGERASERFIHSCTDLSFLSLCLLLSKNLESQGLGQKVSLQMPAYEMDSFEISTE